MGTFCDYKGNMTIPDEFKDEFNENMIKILQRGGMMQFENVHMYGKEIHLIRPVECDEEGKAYFSFNYFEDDLWESVLFNSRTQVLRSGKIGNNEFNRVMCAAYLLYELYGMDYGYVDRNGDIIDPVRCIAWINHVLDKDFTAEKRFHLWKYYESYYFTEIEQDHYDRAYPKTVFGIIPEELRGGMGGRDLADIYYIVYGTGDMGMNEASSGSYPYEIMCVKKELQKFSETYGFDRKKRLYELLKLPYDERQGIACQKYGGLAEMTLRIPARVFVYLFAEIQGFDFWTEWHEVHGEFYVDEITKNYVGESVVKKREEIRNTQIGKLKTKDFLKNNGCFTFYNTPAELKDKPDYYLSDDDLMYWWDGTDTVQLSIRMIETLNRWSVELKKFETEINRDEIEDYDMLKSLLELLDRANHEYRDIYAFQNMFYEFAQNNKDIHYFAAIKLFEKILDENWETGKIIQSVESWSTASKNVICNEGRINVKRYLSVLANKKLRVKCFGF